jgi:putative Ca2+/H+ antiporter (TMEM165/GDT1 family)
MEWKVILSTFFVVFMAELADKTSIATITLSTQSKKPFSVFLGSVAGYMVVTALGVLLGSIMSGFIKPEAIKLCGGFLFVVMGILMLIGKI